jgi:AcrR family transcriptional regulator
MQLLNSGQLNRMINERQVRKPLAARKAVNEELSRGRIMDAARELFAEHGYRAVSMRMVAKELGYSHGAIYYHFQEKAELFCALVDQDFLKLSELLKEVSKRSYSDPVEMMKEVIVEFIRFGLENKKHYEIMFMIDDPEVTAYAQPEKNRCYDQFAKVISTEITKLTGKPADLRIPWLMFVSMHGFVSTYTHTPQAFTDLETMARLHADFLCSSWT